MIDYQRTVDNIRSILASDGPVSVDDANDIAIEYSEACKSTNERLRQCGRLLKDGLRSEAIQRSEAEPNLLGLVAMLDFPELSAWTSFVRANGITSADPILVDIAAELNEAYSVEQPMTALLRRHRLQALGRSPLRDRILTLRKLGTLDTNNSVWRDDLRTYEQARQQEIRRTCDQEYRQGNVAALEVLLGDVRSGDWLESPPASIVQQVVDARSRLVRQRARSELEQIEPQLNEAFAQFDATRGRALRDRWNARADVANLGDDDPLRERAGPALEWLDEQDRDLADDAAYRAAVLELEQALDDEVGLADLQRHAYAAFRFERQIPAVLEQRLRTRLTNLELVRSRRVRLTVGTILGIVLLIASAIGYQLVRSNHAAQVAAHADALQSLMEQRHFTEAQEHLEKLAAASPGVASSPEIQKLGVDLTARIHEERARVASFTEAIEAAERAGDQAPDRKALEEARRLATTDPEKVRVLKLEGAVAAADRSQQAMRDEDFLRRLNELNSRINALDQNRPDEKVLADIREALSALITKTTDISPQVFDRSRATRSRVQALYKTIERGAAMDAALIAIDRSIGDIDRFRTALDQVVKEFPETPRAADFKRVIDEVQLLECVTKWNGFIEQWQKGDVARLGIPQAKELLTASNSILRDHPGYPVAAELRQRMPHLEAICRRGNDRGAQLHKQLSDLFADPLVAGLWLVEMVDDKNNTSRYYLIAPPREPVDSATTILVHHIKDFSRTADSTQSIPRKSITYSAESPQSIVAKKGLDELAKLGDKSWESVFTSIISAIHSQPHLEPVLEVVFLKKATDVACQGSESLRIAFDTYKNLLVAAPIKSDVKWMDPKDGDANQARLLAIDLLGRLPPLERIASDTKTSLNSLSAPLGSKYEWIGWLALEERDSWQFRPIPGLKQNADLFVATPLAEGGLAWTAIGRVRNGRVELQRANRAALVQGRPVFAANVEGGPAAAGNN